MRKLTCTLLIVAILVSGGLTFEGGVHASTQVGGTIASDTTWTQANSPYSLTGQVFVPSNVTLTIAPGVTVNFGNYYIQVNGTLNARGTSDSNIFFSSNVSYSYNQRIEFLAGSTAWNDQNGTGCIIENAVFNNITLTINGSPKISNSSFINSLYAFASINVNGGSPQILNNLINCQNTGVNVGAGSPLISFNTIAGNGHSTGISSYGNSIIQNNIIVNGTYGITVFGSSLIQNNVIAGNLFGVSGSGGNIQSNTIVYNSVGIQFSGGSVIITSNSIFNNYQVSLMVSTSYNLDATNNYWGTTDAGAINKTIRDFKSYSYLGIVSFVPFLAQPNPSAPPLPNINLNYPSTIILGPTTAPTPPPVATVIPTPTPAPTPTPVPSPSPMPKIMPGSPLSLGGSTFSEAISQLDITALAELVLIVLGIVWVIVILVSVVRNFGREKKEKQ